MIWIDIGSACFLYLTAMSTGFSILEGKGVTAPALWLREDC